ncbi:kinase-like protein [Ceraceosorus guamensis]|uniref:Kinase-like protein n=1 Tax=Ceraceosorus guamensis TaxID=1522189 RepID=A0A316WA18_9BASI|nr:kinase-like protein [Ceraceosorus guamensis]PWN45581.1 kinase-like protein [Ceraceosorus guamensis]
MLKGIWPGGPADQITPKASSNKAEERNPFDALTSGSSAPPNSTMSAPGAPADRLSHSRNNSGGPGLGAGLNQGIPFNSLNHADPLTPGMRTPGGVTSHASIPTTSISTSVPDFSMKLPPAKAKNDAASHTTSSGTTRNTSAPRGYLTVKLVSARNLIVGSPSSKPYAVVSFEQNEFIGREPIDESAEPEAKGKAIPVAQADPSGSRARAKTVVPQDAKTGGAATAATAMAVDQGGASAASTSEIEGRFTLHPVWRHEVTFDVTHPDKTIFLSVYDRQAEEEGFLGMREILPRFVHGAASDQWYSLKAREDADVPEEGRGEVRVELKYERISSKKRLTPSDFEYLKLIGRGTFGRVFQVRKKDTKRIYAMKVLSKREIALKKEVTHTMGERRILEKSLDCPFLVGLKFSFQSEYELYFVTDYKSGGELFWHLQREGRFTEERARFYIAELVLALEHLHKYDIVYRDLKPENILLDATGHVALCDFGLSKPDLGAGQLTNTFCGTTEYLAPEVLLDESGYSKLVDFWSLGVLLFEMCCGWSPFYAEDTQQMYRNICFGKIKFPRGAIGDDGKQFVKGLLNRNPKHRLGAGRDAADLRAHAFFREIDFEALSKKQLTPPFKPLVESDESVANFDPEFTETDLNEVAVIPGFEGDAGEGREALESGAILSTSAQARKDAGKQANGVAIKKAGNGTAADGEEDDALSRSVQDKFRGFSYSGTYDGSVAGSMASSFGGRRGSGGFGLAGASLGMSKMQVDDKDDESIIDDAASNGRSARDVQMST